MKKTQKPSHVKALTIGGIALLSAGLVTATVGGIILTNKEKAYSEQLSNKLSKLNAEYNIALTNLDSTEAKNNELKTQLEAMGLELESFKEESLEKDAVIADYSAIVEELNNSIEAVVVFDGYDEDVILDNFNLGQLTDNQFSKLGDYTVDFDGDKVDVEEFLSVAGDFEHEDELSFNFEEGDVAYKLTFESGLDFDEDSLKVDVMGKSMKIIDIESGSMTVDVAPEVMAVEGDVVNGAKIVKIGEDSVVVDVDGEIAVIGNHDDESFGDLTVKVKDLFFDSNGGSMIIVRVGEDIDKVIEVGDYYDDAEQWKYTTIEDGKIVITLDEEQEAVKELVLPNDFAKVSFKLADEDYSDVKVVKDDYVMDTIYADFEDYDASKVEFDSDLDEWVIEDDNGDDVIVSSLDLKDSDFSIDLFNGYEVSVAGVDIDVDEVYVDGDEDLEYVTVEGVVVSERDSWNEDDDDSVTLSVPEEQVEATILVE